MTRNRKRSKRRDIFCPLHGCYLGSTSNKYATGTETWVEEFWCKACEVTRWYAVRKGKPYSLSPVQDDLWKRVTAIDPRGNPTVGEFTRRSAHGRLLQQ